MVWHWLVPGTQSVTLMNGTSSDEEPGGPSLTTIGVVLSTGGEPESGEPDSKSDSESGAPDSGEPDSSGGVPAPSWTAPASPPCLLAVAPLHPNASTGMAASQRFRLRVIVRYLLDEGVD